MGRAKLGKNGTKIVSVTVECDLLKQADAYAKARRMKRSELVSVGLKLAMGGRVKREPEYPCPDGDTIHQHANVGQEADCAFPSTTFNRDEHHLDSIFRSTVCRIPPLR